jgi:hypothetical protein
MIKLYDLAGAESDRRFSPYCWRIRLALEHKQQAVETLPWRFTEKEEIAFSGQWPYPSEESRLEVSTCRKDGRYETRTIQ